MAYFLRFTQDPTRDLNAKYSLETIWDDEEVELLSTKGKVLTPVGDGSYTFKKAGLCGHSLDSETIEGALEEIKEGGYYGDINESSYAIFEGTMHGVAQDTMEGDTFLASGFVFFHKSNSPSDLSL